MFFIVQGIAFLVPTIIMLLQSPAITGGYEFIFSPVWMLISGLLLWRFSRIIATRLFSESDSSISSEGRFTKEDIQGIGISMIGIYVLAFAIPDLVQVIVSVRSQEVSQDVVGDISRAFTQLAIGLGLFLGFRGIVGLGRVFRKAGVEQPNHKQD